MKIKLALALLAGAMILGCNGNSEKPTGQETTGATTPTANGGTSDAKKYTVADIPADLKGEAFEYFGLANSDIVDMEITRTGAAGVQTGTQVTTIKEVKPDEVLFVIERTGGLSELGSQTVALRKGGVFLVDSTGAKMTATGPELPSDVAPGASWSNDFSVERTDGRKIELKTKSTAKGIEKFKTKAGDREGLLVVSTGTGTMDGQPVTISGKSWYVKGSGGVKSVVVYTTKDGQKVEISIEETK